MTPIVHDCDKIGLIAISNAVKTLADKAKTGKIAPTELTVRTLIDIHFFRLELSLFPTWECLAFDNLLL